MYCTADAKTIFCFVITCNTLITISLFCSDRIYRPEWRPPPLVLHENAILSADGLNRQNAVIAAGYSAGTIKRGVWKIYTKERYRGRVFVWRNLRSRMSDSCRRTIGYFIFIPQGQSPLLQFPKEFPLISQFQCRGNIPIRRQGG